MLFTLEFAMIGIAILEIAVGVPSAYVALRSLKNASRGVYVGINFPATWYAEIVAYGTDFGDLESIAVAGIFPAAVAVWTLMLVRLQPASSLIHSASFVAHVASAVVVLEAFLYSFINTYISDEPPHPPVSIKTLGFIGRHGKRYSLEAWTCGVKDLGRLWMYDDFTKMCARTRAARWLMLPLLLVTVVSAVLSWKWRKQNKRRPKPSGVVYMKDMNERSESTN